jgi:hypothetical protein
LVGLCTECGLEFLWRDLLIPTYTRELRFFENARRRLAGSLALTVWRALRPRPFWLWVRMEHEVRPMRMALTVLVGLAATHLCAATLLFLIAAAVTGVTGPMGGDARPWFGYYSDWPELAVAIAWPMGPSEWLWPNSPQVINPLAVVGLAATVLLPGAFVFLPLTLRRAKVRSAHLIRVWAYGLIGLPLALLAPTAYSMAANLASGLFGFQDAATGAAWGERWLEAHRWQVLLACALAWNYWWWTIATGRYLCLPRAWGIALATLALALLVSIAVILLIPGGGLWLTQDW